MSPPHLQHSPHVLRPQRAAACVRFQTGDALFGAARSSSPSSSPFSTSSGPYPCIFRGERRPNTTIMTTTTIEFEAYGQQLRVRVQRSKTEEDGEGAPFILSETTMGRLSLAKDHVVLSIPAAVTEGAWTQWQPAVQRRLEVWLAARPSWLQVLRVTPLSYGPVFPLGPGPLPSIARQWEALD